MRVPHPWEEPAPLGIISKATRLSFAGCLGLLAVVLGVQFCGFGGVMRGVMQMALRRVGVVSCGFVVALVVMSCGFPMVVRGMRVVLSCLAMVLGCLFRHGCPLLCYGVACLTAEDPRVIPDCYGNVSGGLSFKAADVHGVRAASSAPRPTVNRGSPRPNFCCGRPPSGCCPNLNVAPPFRASLAGLKPGATSEIRTAPPSGLP